MVSVCKGLVRLVLSSCDQGCMLAYAEFNSCRWHRCCCLHWFVEKGWPEGSAAGGLKSWCSLCAAASVLTCLLLCCLRVLRRCSISLALGSWAEQSSSWLASSLYQYRGKGIPNRVSGSHTTPLVSKPSSLSYCWFSWNSDFFFSLNKLFVIDAYTNIDGVVSSLMVLSCSPNTTKAHCNWVSAFLWNLHFRSCFCSLSLTSVLSLASF